MSQPIIDVRRLSKTYHVYRSPAGRLRELLGLPGGRPAAAIRALRDVSFSVEPGETLGIIGRNGSGKSTLLQLIYGVLTPTAGSLTVNGRMSALLELGGGFVPMLSGRDNVHMKARILGLSPAEIDKRFDAIVDFADLGEFIDQPVKTYSSGMFIRLAFSVAINVDPEILIVDEALAVGDILFRAKCFARFRDFQQQGVTILFVTHSLGSVVTYCNRALLLEAGQLVQQGAPKPVIEEYNRRSAALSQVPLVHDTEDELFGALSSSEEEWAQFFTRNDAENRYGQRQAEILEAGVFTLTHEPVQDVSRHQEVLIKVKVRYNQAVPAVDIGYVIRNLKGVALCGTSTLLQDTKLPAPRAGEVILVTFRQRLPLNPGGYLLSVGIAREMANEQAVYDYRGDYLPLRVAVGSLRFGLFDVNARVEWERL